MPLRLPMRRKASAEAAPFRRRTPPTPQATRLMRTSLAAGLILVVILGIVFVPIALRYGETKPVTIVLGLVGQNPFVIEVASVSAPFALNTYRVWVNATNPNASSVYVYMEPVIANHTWTGGVAFTDADGDGTLSVRDRFTVQPQPGAGWIYELSVFNFVRDRDARSPCPCPIVIYQFPPR